MAKQKETVIRNFHEVMEKSASLTNASESSEYYLRRNRNLKITCSRVKDEVDGMFTINFKQPLPQFNTAFGKAYAVIHKFGAENETYAIILDKRYPIRLAEINKIASKTFDNMVNIVAAQVVPSSFAKGRVFAVILEYPNGTTLHEYIKKNGALKQDYLTRILIPAIGLLIADFIKLGITHGKINIDNVYIDETGRITVGECISEACGYSQPMIYETINRATAMPSGKGNGDEVVDYHALGVLVAILLRGKDITEGLDQEEILSRKFEDGTYKIVTSGLEMQLQMLDFMRGMLANRKTEIWGFDQLEEWIRGRRFNLLPPAENNEDNRAISFNGKKYLSRKYLVHRLYLHWDEGKKFLRTDSLIKWVARNPHEHELVERLEMLLLNYNKEKTDATFDNEDEILAQYILLLDPTGPIRMRDFSAHLDGLGCALAEAFFTNNISNRNAIKNIILHNLQVSIPSNIISASNSAQEANISLQKCVDFLRKKDLGFGIERCLYELNRTLPCQSPKLIDEAPFIVQEALLLMDESESIGGDIVDVHIAAFLSERLDLQNKVYLSSLKSFPEFGKNIHIQALALLALAQQTSEVGPLLKLATKICESLKNMSAELHSKEIRNAIEKSIQKSSEKGILANILRIMTNPKYLVKDRLGFKNASKAYKNNGIQIVKLSNSKVVNNVGYRYGLQLAVMMSFFVATVEIITLILKAF